jgi:hypothetical protein
MVIRPTGRGRQAARLSRRRPADRATGHGALGGHVQAARVLSRLALHRHRPLDCARGAGHPHRLRARTPQPADRRGGNRTNECDHERLSRTRTHRELLVDGSQLIEVLPPTRSRLRSKCSAASCGRHPPPPATGGFSADFPNFFPTGDQLGFLEPKTGRKCWSPKPEVGGSSPPCPVVEGNSRVVLIGNSLVLKLKDSAVREAALL